MQNADGLAFMWTPVSVTLILVIVRTYVRWSRTKMLRISDLFAILAWLSFLLEMILGTWMIGYGLVSVPLSIRAFDFPLKFPPSAAKTLFVSAIFYLNAMYCVKASVVAIYFEWISSQNIRTRRCLLGLALFTFICWIAQLCFAAVNTYSIISCREPEPTLEQYASCRIAKSSNGLGLFGTIAYFGGHGLTDLLIYVLPIPTVVKLFRSGAFSFQKKFGLAISFGAGFLSIGILFGYLGATIRAEYDDSDTLRLVVLGFYVMEQSYALVALCAPAAIGCFARALSWLRNRPTSSDRENARRIKVWRSHVSACVGPEGDIEAGEIFRSDSCSSGECKTEDVGPPSDS